MEILARARLKLLNRKGSLSGPALWAAARSLSGRHLVTTFGAQIAILGLGAFTGVMAARLLGPAGRGELAALVLWPSTLISLASMGLNQSVVFHSGRDLYTLSEVWTASAAIGLGQALAAILVGLPVLPLALRSYSHSVNHLALLFLIVMPLLLFQNYPCNILQGKLHMGSFNLTRALGPLVYALGLALIWWLRHATLSYVVASQIAGCAVTTAVGYWIFLKRFSIRVVWNAGACRSLLRFGWQTQAGQVSSFVNQRLDQLVLSLFIAPAQLGLYAVAVTASSVVAFIPTAIGIVTLARGVNLAPALAKNMIGLSFRRSLVYLSVFCVLLFIAAPRLITLFFGSRFSGAALPCRILLGGMVAVGAAQVLYEGARALGQPLLSFYAEGLSMIVTCLGLYLLLPRYGIVGAAITSTVAYCCALVLILTLCWLRLDLGLRQLLGGVSLGEAPPAGIVTPPASPKTNP